MTSPAAVGRAPKSRVYQAKFLLNGQDRTEKVPAATPYDAIKSIQTKYAPDDPYVYHIRVISTEAESAVRP